jgi:hypothetical protein
MTADFRWSHASSVDKPICDLHCSIRSICRYHVIGRGDEMKAVNVAVGPRIMLQSGAWFDFLDPESSEFGIEDIAAGLSNTCRYAGLNA